MIIDWTWITTTGTAVLMAGISALGIYIALVLFTRLAGLRSFSKISSFDFAITVAFGTMLASTMLVKDPPLLRAIATLGVLYLIQFAVSFLRQRSSVVSSMVDNKPLLLMAGPEILRDNLYKARITEEDLHGKLREANVIDYSQVRAVVMEATGDVSVLHADEDGPDLNPNLLSGVRDADRLRSRSNVEEVQDATEK